MNILITGGNGQVGFELCRSFSFLGQVFAPSRNTLDLTDKVAVDAFLKQLKPDLILNAAAYTAVDRAEQEPELAFRLNAELPEQLASYAHLHRIPLVHYSSDYVYPGTGNRSWKEDDCTGPVNTYGQSKLGGDQTIISSGADYLIFRTSWVYAARGHNFMKTMLRLGQEKDALSIVSDQIGAPTPARMIAGVTQLALTAEKRPHAGIYHLAPRGETSWYEFAQHIFRLAEQQGYPLTLSSESIQAITSVDYPTPAKRPKSSKLNVNKLEQTLNITLPDWQSQLELTVNEYINR